MSRRTFSTASTIASRSMLCLKRASSRVSKTRTSGPRHFSSITAEKLSITSCSSPASCPASPTALSAACVAGLARRLMARRRMSATVFRSSPKTAPGICASSCSASLPKKNRGLSPDSDASRKSKSTRAIGICCGRQKRAQKATSGTSSFPVRRVRAAAECGGSGRSGSAQCPAQCGAFEIAGGSEVVVGSTPARGKQTLRRRAKLRQIRVEAARAIVIAEHLEQRLALRQIERALRFCKEASDLAASLRTAGAEPVVQGPPPAIRQRPRTIARLSR